MKLNFRPNKVAFLDFETQSEYDLKKGTARKYSQHPSTKALTCVIKVGDTMFRMGPYLTDFDKETLTKIAAKYTLVAHNAPFDAAIWENVLKLPEAEWFDTLPCARAAGLPGGLDKLSTALGGRGKHKDGERLIQMLCCVKPGRIPAVGPAHKLLMEYNVQDVEELETVYDRVCGFGEPELLTVDRMMNDRGIKIDKFLLDAILALYQENNALSKDKFSEQTGGINPRSSQQVKAWLAEHNFPVEGCNKHAMNSLIANPEEFFCGDTDTNEFAESLEAMRTVVELRREFVGIGQGKAEAALKGLDEDNYLRDLLIPYGAHTGRWTSRHFQVHNLPGRIKFLDMRHVEPTLAAVSATAAEASKQAGVNISVSDCIGSMLRRLVSADNLLVVDYAAIEARCLAWIAEDPLMLARYTDPYAVSLYYDMGKTVFGRDIDKVNDPAEYVVAKALFLGAGYGMSGAKFQARLSAQESRATVEKFKASGTTAADAVKAYRKLFPTVPELWKLCDTVVKATVKTGVVSEAGRCTFLMSGNDLHIILPSGRPFVYRNARIEMLIPMYCKMYGMPEVPVPTVVFDNPRGFGYLYGSKIVENICQAICRDLLADAIVKCWYAGLNPLLHVHDELVCAAPENELDTMMRIMTEPPDWAAGFPVKVEGYSGGQWSKISEGYKEQAFQLGRRL